MNHCISILLLLLIGEAVFAQPITSSHKAVSMLAFNPAYAGVKRHAGVYLNYRNQWPDLSGNYVNYHAGYSQYFDEIQGGVGLVVNNYTSNQGLLNDLMIDGIYSYALQVARESYLYGALKVSYGMHHINREQVLLGDMFNPVTEDFSLASADPYITSYNHYIDFGTGLLWKHWDYRANTTLQAGVSVSHLTQPTYANNSIKYRKYAGHLSYRFPLYRNRLGREALHIEPAIYYSQQLHFNELIYGIHLHMPQYYLGLLFKQNTDLHLFSTSLSAGIKRNSYTLAYSYDMVFGTQYVYTSNLGAHEVTFLYHLEYKGRRAKFR